MVLWRCAPACRRRGLCRVLRTGNIVSSPTRHSESPERRAPRRSCRSRPTLISAPEPQLDTQELVRGDGSPRSSAARIDAIPVLAQRGGIRVVRAASFAELAQTSLPVHSVRAAVTNQNDHGTTHTSCRRKQQPAHHATSSTSPFPRSATSFASETHPSMLPGANDVHSSCTMNYIRARWGQTPTASAAPRSSATRRRPVYRWMAAGSPASRERSRSSAAAALEIVRS